MLQIKVVEKIKTRILCSKIFFSDNRAVYEIILKKYGTARQATYDTTRRIPFACWITKATQRKTHTHTHKICNTYCSSTPTMVWRTRFDFTLHVHCISCDT